MRLELLEKVIEKLPTSEAITIGIERQPDGKMRVTSGSWEGEKIFLPGQVLEGRDGQYRPAAVRCSQNQGAQRLGPTL